MSDIFGLYLLQEPVCPQHGDLPHDRGHAHGQPTDVSVKKVAILKNCDLLHAFFFVCKKVAILFMFKICSKLFLFSYVIDNSGDLINFDIENSLLRG